MKIVNKYKNKKVEASVLRQYKLLVKDAKSHNLAKVLEDVLDYAREKIDECGGEVHYEIRGFYTKSGNPGHIYLNSNDFKFEEISE